MMHPFYPLTQEYSMSRMSQRSTIAAPWHARQGDVLVVRIDAIPASARPRVREGGRVILAHGEVTGHAHAIDDAPSAPTALLLDTEDATFLRVDAVSQLMHDEHGAITLEPGNYRVIRQREYVAPEIERSVAD